MNQLHQLYASTGAGSAFLLTSSRKLVHHLHRNSRCVVPLSERLIMPTSEPCPDSEVEEPACCETPPPERHCTTLSLTTMTMHGLFAAPNPALPTVATQPVCDGVLPPTSSQPEIFAYFTSHCHDCLILCGDQSPVPSVSPA